MVAATYAGCNHLLVFAYFIVSIGAQGFITCGTMINPMDLSPNYAGAISSLSNAAGSLTGIAAPSIVGIMTPNVSSRYQIKINFYSQRSINNLSTILFPIV